MVTPREVREGRACRASSIVSALQCKASGEVVIVTVPLFQILKKECGERSGT